MSRRIWLIRHGETHWNAERRYQGWSSIGLSPTGVQAVRELAGALIPGEGPCWASDLLRSRETVAILGLEPTVFDPRLRELDLGSLEGLTWEEAEALHGDRLRRWAERPAGQLPPEGVETVENLLGRVEEGWREWGDRIGAVVAHGGSLRALVATVLGVDWDTVGGLEWPTASAYLLRETRGDGSMRGRGWRLEDPHGGVRLQGRLLERERANG